MRACPIHHSTQIPSRAWPRGARGLAAPCFVLHIAACVAAADLDDGAIAVRVLSEVEVSIEPAVPRHDQRLRRRVARRIHQMRRDLPEERVDHVQPT